MTPVVENGDSEISFLESSGDRNKKNIIDFIDSLGDEYETIILDPEIESFVQRLSDDFEGSETEESSNIKPVRVIRALKGRETEEIKSFWGLGLALELEREEKESWEIERMKRNQEFSGLEYHDYNKLEAFKVLEGETTVLTILSLPVPAEQILLNHQMPNETRRRILEEVCREIKYRNETRALETFSQQIVENLIERFFLEGTIVQKAKVDKKSIAMTLENSRSRIIKNFDYDPFLSGNYSGRSDWSIHKIIPVKTEDEIMFEILVDDYGEKFPETLRRDVYRKASKDEEGDFFLPVTLSIKDLRKSIGIKPTREQFPEVKWMLENMENNRDLLKARLEEEAKDLFYSAMYHWLQVIQMIWGDKKEERFLEQEVLAELEEGNIFNSAIFREFRYSIIGVEDISKDDSERKFTITMKIPMQVVQKIFGLKSDQKGSFYEYTFMVSEEPSNEFENSPDTMDFIEQVLKKD